MYSKKKKKVNVHLAQIIRVDDHESKHYCQENGGQGPYGDSRITCLFWNKFTLIRGKLCMQHSFYIIVIFNHYVTFFFQHYLANSLGRK